MLLALIVLVITALSLRVPNFPDYTWVLSEMEMEDPTVDIRIYVDSALAGLFFKKCEPVLGRLGGILS